MDDATDPAMLPPPQSPPPPMSDGERMAKQLSDNGYSPDEIDGLKAQMTDALTKNNYSPQEVRDFWGIKNPDNRGLKAVAKAGVVASQTKADGTKREPIDASVKPVPAENMMDAMAAAYGDSIPGMIQSGQQSPLYIPKDAPPQQKIAGMASGLLADSPAMFLGGLGAGPTGAFGLPAGIRATLVDSIRNKDFIGPKDFAERIAKIGWETGKGAATGYATGAAAANIQALNALGSPLTQALTGTATRSAAELAAMTTVSAGLEGHLPRAEDFMYGAVAIGGLHAVGYGAGKAGYVAEKLQNIYANSGEHPAEVVDAASNDPFVKQQVLSENPDLPIEAKQYDSPLENAKKSDGPPKTASTEGSILPKDSRDEILSRIGDEDKDDRSYPQKMVDAGTDVKDTLLKAWKDSVDFTWAVGKTLEKQNMSDLPAEVNAHKLMNLLPANGAKMNLVMNTGTLDFATKKINGESYKNFKEDYAKEFPDDPQMKDFRAYGLAKHRQDLVERGFQRGGDSDNDQATIAAGEKRLQPFLDRWVDFQNKGLKYLKDSGRISQESYDNITSVNQNYMDSHVQVDVDPLTGKYGGGGSAVPKKIGDSDLKMKDPIMSGLKAWELRIKVAEENNTKQVFHASQMVLPEDQRVIRELPDHKGALTSGQSDVYYDGKRTVFEGQKDVIDALNRIKGDQTVTPLWAKMLGPWNATLRFLTVGNPLFALRHATKNQMIAATYSNNQMGIVEGLKSGYKPGESWLGVLANIAKDEGTRSAMPLDAKGDPHDVIPYYMKGNQSYIDFVARGGAAEHVMPIDSSSVDREMQAMNSRVPFVNKAWNSVKDVAGYAHSSISINDNGIRFSQYEKQIAQGDSPLEAAYQARQVLPDWQKASFQKSALQTSKAFLKIKMVGLDKFWSEIGDSDKSAGFIAKNLAYVTSMELLMQAANYGDDRMDDIPLNKKNSHWVTYVDNWRAANSQAEVESRKAVYPKTVRQADDGSWQVNDGKPWAFPKPFENGTIFGSGIGALFDTMKRKDPKAMGAFIKTMVEMNALDPIPDGPKPLFEQYVNKNFWSGQPIIRQSMENKLPFEQYDQNTSELAKLIGKGLSKVPFVRDIGPDNAKLPSPEVIDNYMHDWGGTMGQYIIDGVDKGLRASGVSPPDYRPVKTTLESPFIREFVINHPEYHPQTVQDFQDRLRESQQALATIASLKKKGPGGAKEIQYIIDNYSDKLENLGRWNSGINKLRQGIAKLDVDPNTPDNEKRQNEQLMYMAIILAAKKGNETMDKFEEEMKNQKAGK